MSILISIGILAITLIFAILVIHTIFDAIDSPYESGVGLIALIELLIMVVFGGVFLAGLFIL